MGFVELWPMFGLRVVSPSVELFVPAGDELAAVAALAARGIYDPQRELCGCRPPDPGTGWRTTPPAEEAVMTEHTDGVRHTTQEERDRAMAVHSVDDETRVHGDPDETEQVMGAGGDLRTPEPEPEDGDAD